MSALLDQRLESSELNPRSEAEADLPSFWNGSGNASANQTPPCDRAVALAREVKPKPRLFDPQIWIGSSDLRWNLVQEEPDPRSMAGLAQRPVSG